MSFGHLHLHTMYSALDGLGKVNEIVERAVELGQTFIAITDHGSTSGLYHFQKECERVGIKPILGTEFYTGSFVSERKSGHLIVLAKNAKGLENIFKLQEYAMTTGFKWKPRISMDILERHSEGLIVTSACLANTINQHIMANDMWSAIAEIKEYKRIFGDDFYLEIQSNTVDVQKRTNEILISLAKEYDVKFIITNDVHYVYKDDWYPHEVQLALQMNRKMDDPKRFKFPTTDFWLKSEEEMFEPVQYIGIEDFNEAVRNTQEIADKCSARIEKGNHLPKFYGTPKDSTPRKEMVKLIKDGVSKKNYAMHAKDIQNEIDVIDGEGLSDYFLIVQDYINAARKAGIIVGDGRGSGAGSKAAYVMDIHRVDPHKYNLLFERFLAPGRHPDIDVDFSDQDFVFRYLQSKYGKENVAHVITFGTLTPKAVARKVFSAFGFTMVQIKQINKHISEDDKTIDDALKRSAELRAYKAKHPEQFKVIERLEGVISHEGKHAGGIVISENLTSKLPIKTESKDNRQGYIACFDKDMLEELGFWKFDVLGLKTLPVVKKCLDWIKLNHEIDVDLYKIDYEDQEVYAQLQTGDVSGVFQLANQSGAVVEQMPKSFDDLIAINALIRPGVGDWGEYIARRGGKHWSIHPDRMPYMADTMGTMTYQEQFLLDAVTFAKWGVAYADKNLRKNKDIRNDVELKEKFLHDSMEHGYKMEELTQIWAEIEDAVDGGYSFNKSHSASYGMLSYQTAWLKHYYPIEWYAALMTIKGDDQNEVAGLIAEAKKKGITILPPDFNTSTDEFFPTNSGIRYRISTITHVGDTAITGIRAVRPIGSFEDLLARREKKSLKSNAIKSLIKAGAFDTFGRNRGDLLWDFDMHNRKKTQIKENFQCETYNDDLKTRLTWEKESLGMYISAHPMDKYSFKSLDTFDDNGSAFIGGEVIEVSVGTQANGKEMCFTKVDTGHGVVKVLVFANNWASKSTKMIFQEGNVLLIRGRKSGDALLFNSAEELI